MTTLERTLAAELARTRDEERRLGLRARHLEVALRSARTGLDASIVTAMLQVAGITLPSTTTQYVQAEEHIA